MVHSGSVLAWLGLGDRFVAGKCVALERAEHAPAEHAPPILKGGVKSQTADVDWFTGTGSESACEEVDRLLGLCFGDSGDGHGDRWYADRRHYEGGADLFTSCRAGRSECLVRLNGSTLGSLEPFERFELLKGLYRAGISKCTRIDLCVDFRGEHVDLVDRMKASRDAGEVVGTRKFEYKDGGGARSRDGKCLWLGRRGKNGSGRYGRCYDKGLETKTLPENKWHRLEIEFSGEVARSAFALLLQSEDPTAPRMMEWQERGEVCEIKDTWQDQAAALVMGAFDFREVSGSREYKRRPRCAWWSAFLGDIEGVRLKAARRVAASLQSTKKWLNHCVFPTLSAMARRTGQSLADVVCDLADDVSDVKKVLRASVFQYECQYVAQKGVSVGEEVERACKSVGLVGGGVSSGRLFDLW